jgi:hypothetical protein
MLPFGLLFMMVPLPMNLLSGATSASKARHRTSPSAGGHAARLANHVQIFPPTNFVNFAQVILYRGAGIAIV